MIKIKLLEDLLSFMQRLNKRDFERFTLGVIAGSILLTTGITYVILQQRSSLITRINSLQKLSREAQKIRQEYKAIQKDRSNILEILHEGETKDFEIKSFLETFSHELNLKPTSDWNTTINSIEGNSLFEEVVLDASFSSATTKTLVDLLEKLQQEPLVYVKRLEITKQHGTTISFDIAFATLKFKQGTEE